MARSLRGAKLYGNYGLYNTKGEKVGSSQRYDPVALTVDSINVVLAEVLKQDVKVVLEKPMRLWVYSYPDNQQNNFYINSFDVSAVGKAVQDALNWLNPPLPPAPTAPKILWTQKWQDTWEKAYKENHPWFQKLVELANQGTDVAYWALLYQITKDGKWAEKVWTTMKPSVDTLFDGAGVNLRMSNFHLWTLAFDWTRDWLEANPSYSPTEKNLATNRRDAYVNMLNLMVDKMREKSGVSDSDATTGNYIGYMFWYLATKDFNPKAKEVWEGNLLWPYDATKIGGFTATPGATNAFSVRDAIASYVKQSRGGLWPEGTDYDMVTEQFVILMWMCSLVANGGVENFPEVKTFLVEAARFFMTYHTMPLFSGKYDDGDVERVRATMWISHRVTYAGLLAGALQQMGDPLAPAMYQLLDDLLAYPGNDAEPAYYAHAPYSRFFLGFDPYYTPRKDWKAERPAVVIAGADKGLGLILHRSGETLAGIQYAANTGLDHSQEFFMDLRHYDGEEFVWDHPLGWGWWNQKASGDGANSMLFAGLGKMKEFAELSYVEKATDNSWLYAVGSTGGQFGDEGWSNPPKLFLHEGTRETIYLAPDTYILIDRVRMQSPFDTGNGDISNFGYWGSRVQQAIQEKHLVEFVVHSPVKPDVLGNELQWHTPKGKLCRVITLNPADAGRKVLDETNLWAYDSLAFPATERKWQSRLVSNEEWTLFVNVLTTNPLYEAKLITDGVIARGVHLVRPGKSDFMVSFNPNPGERLPQINPDVNSNYKAPYDPLNAGRIRNARLMKDSYKLLVNAPKGATLLALDLDKSVGWKNLTISNAGLALVPVQPGVTEVAIQRM